MYRKDHFLKFKQQFSKILDRLLELKDHGKKEEALSLLKDSYMQLFGVTKEAFSIPINNSSISAIQQKLDLSDEQLESWARLLFEEGELHQLKFTFYENALSILIYLNEKQRLYSFEREELIDYIKSRLHQ